ncbi:MAG: TonB-dependent receptor [Verrucomicrobia bacterium]|nr:TonB-dependent receptor [Verrucomicrobiota bacterium]
MQSRDLSFNTFATLRSMTDVTLQTTRMLCNNLTALALIATLGLSSATATEPVLVSSPIFIEGKRPNSYSIATTTIEFSPNQLEASSAGLSESAPNFFAASSGARSFNDTFALRGLTNTPIFGDPAVTFYLDDIPLGGGFTTPDVFCGITLAELHRGPGHNTIFGQAGPAGVVQLTTPNPETKAFGEINARAGNFSARNASISAGSVSGQKADVFISAQHGTRNGYIYNQLLGLDIDHRQSSAALARLNFYPTETFKLTLIAQSLRARDGEQPLVPLNGPLYTIDRNNSGETNLDTRNAGLTAAAITSWGRVSLTSSVNDWKLGPYRSVLAFGPAELLNDVQLAQRNYNQELKLASSDRGDFRWHSGLFYSDRSTTGTFTRAFGPFVLEDSSYTIDTTHLAAFGETSLTVQSAVTLTAGLRVEEVKKSFGRNERTPSNQAYTLQHRSSALTPKLEAGYEPTQNLRFFGSVGAGFKPGGFSAFTGNRSLAAFGPERTLALEGGVSHSAFHDTLTWTARAFVYNIRGYQIERSFATGAATDDYLVVSAPRARSTGFELEATWRPAKALSITAGYGRTQVILRDFTDPFTGQSLDGNRAPYVPSYDFSLRCDYKHASGWFITAKLSTNGKTYYTESENDAFAQRNYSLLGARAGFAAGHWRFSLFAENILNRDYYSSISAGTNHGTPGAPRTQGLEVQYAF